jgi:chemotaxis protein CheY-P-specific phosphatase CheC
MRIDLNKLMKLNKMAKEGAQNVAYNLSQMLGIDVEMKVAKIEFVDLSDVPDVIGDREVIGVYLTFQGLPSGFLVVLFPTKSAKKITNLLLQGIEESNGDGFSEMDLSAISEVGNIITSSFIDGWANLLNSEINISTPQTVHDMGSAVIDPILIQIAQQYDNAFLFNSYIKAKNEDINCELLVIPELEKLMEAIDRL